MGRGIIHVNHPFLGKPEEGSVVNEPQSLAEWHSTLMLPEDYRLLEAKLLREFQDQVWELLVENDAILGQEGKLTEVSPIFRVDYNQEDGTSKNYLDRIEINRYAPNMQVIWQAPKEQ